jgi:UDP-N-acetylglucosamine 2-epimerase (non-hydrolysing)
MKPYRRSPENNMDQSSCLFCLGTASETVRTMPVYRMLGERGIRSYVLHSAFQDGGVKALHETFAMRVDVATEGLSPTAKHPSAALMDDIERALSRFAPSLILIEDGSATATAAALAAYARGIPIAHIDAGLRTYAETPPYFEKNQELIARLARWHFTATEQAKSNLLEEGIAPPHIYEVGSTLIDAAYWTREHLHATSPGHSYSFTDNLREFLFLCRSRRLVLAALDESEATPETVDAVAQALCAMVAKRADCLAICVTSAALHAPMQAALKRQYPDGHERLYHSGPLAFPGLTEVVSRAHIVVTDCSDIEQLASAFAKPVLLAVDTHAGHQDLVQAGGAKFVGTRLAGIGEGLETLLGDSAQYKTMQLQASPFGDGEAARRIADVLAATT